MRSILLLAAALLALPALAHAEPKRPDVSGEIAFEEAGSKQNPDAESRDAGIAFYQSFDDAVGKLSRKESATVGEMDDQTLGYLGAVYLYCTLKTGACPLVLDGVLEVDIARAKLGLAEGCPHMKHFWVMYGKNELEARHQYMVKTAHLMVVDKFNKEQRPKYFNCEGFVQSALADGPAAPADYFAQRYAPGSDKRMLSSKMYNLLSGLKLKVPNLFIELGARLPNDAPTNAGRGAARPASQSRPAAPSHPAQSSRSSGRR